MIKEIKDYYRLFPLISALLASTIALAFAAVLAAPALSSPSFKNAAWFTGYFILIFFLLLVLERFWLKRHIRHCSSRNNLLKHLLIMGTHEAAADLAHHIDRHPESGLRVSGFVSIDEQDIGRLIGKHAVVGTVNHLSDMLKNQVVDCVFFTPSLAYLPYIEPVFYRCRTEGIDFGYLTCHPPCPRDGVSVEQLKDVTLVFLKTVMQSPTKLFIKRLFDFLSATVLFCVLLPFWFTIAILIKRESAGPVFFRQERLGKNGRRFIMYKFRSMVDNAEKYQADLSHLNEMDGPAFKIKNDPRQTRIGRILRQTSLDELPQLFNVFKGEISLVGPRPPIYKEVMAYRPWERKRLSVIPGITCLWQVSGRNNIKFDEWMKLDLMYIENWSFGMDIKILLKTIPAVLSREGAG